MPRPGQLLTPPVAYLPTHAFFLTHPQLRGIAPLQSNPFPDVSPAMSSLLQPSPCFADSFHHNPLLFRSPSTAWHHSAQNRSLPLPFLQPNVSRPAALLARQIPGLPVHALFTDILLRGITPRQLHPFPELCPPCHPASSRAPG